MSAEVFPCGDPSAVKVPDIEQVRLLTWKDASTTPDAISVVTHTSVRTVSLSKWEIQHEIRLRELFHPVAVFEPLNAKKLQNTGILEGIQVVFEETL
jgi:hypothetical protein